MKSMYRMRFDREMHIALVWIRDVLVSLFACADRSTIRLVATPNPPNIRKTHTHNALCPQDTHLRGHFCHTPNQVPARRHGRSRHPGHLWRQVDHCLLHWPEVVARQGAHADIQDTTQDGACL